MTGTANKASHPRLQGGLRRLPGVREMTERASAIAQENDLLRETLTWIADPSYVGNYSDSEMVAIHRKWAQRALARTTT